MSEAKCPFTGNSLTKEGTYNKDWWPNQLDLSPLRRYSEKSNPMDSDFDYAKEFESLDLDALKKDIDEALTTSQDWWPADWGNYGPLFIRMAWHAAGTYRTTDGRGGAGEGMQRFAPTNSWPDNANLDKARRLLWPVKKKYGKKISWADLMILAGNVALENMGFKTFGFGGGRADVYEADDTYWGSETEWLGDNRYSGERDLENPLAAVQMGLIYVNPEGPNGNPDPLLSAKDIRETFARMAMNDEETVALTAGGHAFGKMHGAGDAKNVGPEPEAAPIEQMGLGWKNSFGKGNAEDTITSGIEGAWTPTPTKWDNSYLKLLMNNEWKQVKSPAGATQWIPVDESLHNIVPDAHVEGKFNPPVMTTADMALKMDPEYAKISQRFLEDFDYFSDVFARAWFKLTHRDMGPIARYLGKEVPSEQLIWQDPIHASITKDIDVESIKNRIKSSDIPMYNFVYTAWASASTFRKTDKRGGANGARIRLQPQNTWEANNHEIISDVISFLETLQKEHMISIADLIVLAGCAAIEKASGEKVNVSFTPGRGDATQEQTDIESFAVLEPIADGFRNYIKDEVNIVPEVLLIEKANMLNLTPVELVVLLSGIRTLENNNLDNSYLIKLLSYINADQAGNTPRIDLIIASNSELRAIAEVYASDDANEKFINDFAKAWDKVMMLDRFDTKKENV
ncbi:catalase/peroxidase HPI [bacterium]|nr:catalase/peroxidase HPI [Candidatus Elulimicrobium humile]